MNRETTYGIAADLLDGRNVIVVCKTHDMARELFKKARSILAATDLHTDGIRMDAYASNLEIRMTAICGDGKSRLSRAVFTTFAAACGRESDRYIGATFDVAYDEDGDEIEPSALWPHVFVRGDDEPEPSKPEVGPFTLMRDALRVVDPLKQLNDAWNALEKRLDDDCDDRFGDVFDALNGAFATVRDIYEKLDELELREYRRRYGELPQDI